MQGTSFYNLQVDRMHAGLRMIAASGCQQYAGELGGCARRHPARQCAPCVASAALGLAQPQTVTVAARANYAPPPQYSDPNRGPEQYNHPDVRSYAA